MTGNIDADENQQKIPLDQRARKISGGADAGDPFNSVEQFNLDGLTAEQIRELMAACPESFEQDSEMEQSEDDG